MDSLFCKNLCSRLNTLVKDLNPVVKQICELDSQAPKQQKDPTFQKFLGNLKRAAELVKICENVSPLNVFLRCRYASQMLKLEKDINDYIQHYIPAAMFLNMKKLGEDLKDAWDVQSKLVESTADLRLMMNDAIFKQASKLTNDPHENTLMLNWCEGYADYTASCNPSCKSSPEKPKVLVGLQKSIWIVKEILFEKEVSLVGVQCMGGGGKTTLSLALCDDSEIKEFFGNNVVFITVSQSPNLKGVLETMWEKLIRTRKPEFQNAEDAHIQLKQQLSRQSKPTLVVLDDVWSRADLDKLLFEAEGYKTLLTTRNYSIVPKNSSTRLYQLPLLELNDALSLFCFWAFGQTSIPTTADENLVKQVQAECRGLPLALKVIGSSLHGEPQPIWERAKNKLSKAEPISDYHKDEVLRCLETSIDFLDEEARGCFLDLGAFPKGKKVCADALLDIWVYVRKLEWQDAFVILLELASKSLLNLTNNLGSQAISYGSASELYFFQHDVMRDLALYLACHDSIVNCKRLFMPRRENNLPKKWEELSNQTSKARIVSINTGSMDECQWGKMNFPEVEALVLVFDASKYFLPSFMKTMRKLKVLLIINCGSNRATVNGVAALSSPIKLKSIRLERLIVPPFQELKQASSSNLEKLSLSLCEGLGNLTMFNIKPKVNLPIMQDVNLDHCSDLEELPLGIFNMATVQKCSITNCHLVLKLPDDFGKLSSLRMLRLSACPGLKELPASICKLKQLEYLDISLCECLSQFPECMGKLWNLKEIDMRECSRLKKLPKSFKDLKTLKLVICDEKIAKEWIYIKSSAIPSLTVEVVEENFNLDWLDD